MKEFYINHYKVIRKIGEGGMAEVYLAYDSKVGRQVAIKAQDVPCKRFMREAQYLSSLSHPHILKVYDFFVEKNKPFMVMEYCEGVTLGIYLQKNKLSVQEKLKLFAHVVSAVDYAHKNKIIHRDLKPSNIIVDNKGIPYLMDFGIAKQLNSGLKSLTKGDKVVGTLFYMAPEQAKGEKRNIDYLSDVYSLGAILYEILTGERYVGGDSEIQVFYRVVNDNPVPLRKKNPQIPRVLEDVCLKALQKEKKHRYQSAKAFYDDICAVLDNKPVSASGIGNFWGYYYKKICIGVVAIVSLVVFIVLYSDIFSSDKQIHIEKKSSATSVIDDWIDQGFYDKAHEELQSAQQKLTTRKYYEYLLVIYAKKQEDSLFTEIRKKLQKPFSATMDLAIGERYFHQQQNIKAREFFSRVLVSDSLHLKKYAYYYLGRLHYNAKEYHLALESFVQSEDITSNRNFFDRAMLHFFMGKCYFYLAKYSRAIEHLLTAQKELQQFAEVYYYLGKAHFFTENYDEALRYLQKSIEFDRENSDYHVWLGKLLVRQKKYAKAGRIFQQARLLDPLNSEALQEFTAIATQDLNLLEIRYLKLVADLEYWRYKPENVLNIPIGGICDKYRYHYLQYVKLKDISANRESIVNLVQKLKNPDPKIQQSARSGLLLMRYSKTIVDILKKVGQLQIAIDILKIRQKEELYALYYIMAQASLHPRSHLVESLNIEKMQQVLIDQNENVLHRYIAAKSMLLKCEFEKIEWLRKYSEDVVLQIVCARALQDMDMFTTRKTTPMPISEFTELKMARICAGIHRFYHYDTKQNTSLLQGDAISAMLLGQSLMYVDNKLAAKIFAAYTKKKYHVKIRCAAYHYLGILMQYNEKLMLKHGTTWQKACAKLLQQPTTIQIILLQQSKLMQVPIPPKIVRKLVLSNTTTYAKIAAIDYMHKMREHFTDEIERYYKEGDPLVRLYAFMKIFRQKLGRSIEFMDPLPLINSDSDFLRSYGYSIYAATGKEVLDFLEKEKNPRLQAVILKNVGMIPFLISKNEIKSRSERQKIAQKYFTAKDNTLRTYAYGAYAYLSEDKDIERLVEEMKDSDDFYARKGISLAMNRRILQGLMMTNGSLVFLNVFVSTHLESEVPYLDKFAMRIQEPKWVEYYQKLFKQMRILKFVDANDYFREGIIAKKNEDYQKACALFSKAIELDEKIVYYLELLNATWKHSRKVPVSVAKRLQTLTRERAMHPKYYKILLEIPYHPAIEDILKQNSLSLAANHNEKVYNLAWYNLVTYNRSNSRRQQSRMYGSILRNSK
ncbi:protein kinase domain-containing protein [Candidatus Uabimicrobium amorphum]|nr:protein kinase [Candidatus Uabimicrobium amorphum]